MNLFYTRTASLFMFCLSTISALAQTLGTIESVEYDAVGQRFLVSNVNNVMIVDGDGAAVAPLGGASKAAYGMEIMNGILFTITGGGVKGYLLSTGAQVMTAALSGSTFLNGMASDGDNMLWVTDFSGKQIYSIDVTDLANPVVEVLVANTVTTPNGIVYDASNNRLVFVNWGSNAPIKAVDLATSQLSTITSTSLGSCDGVDHDNNGNYFVASWSPNRITKFSSNFTVNEIITAPGVSSPADICYATENDTLAIPNTGNSTVTFVGFGTVSMNEKVENFLGLSCYPNPINEQSIVSFDWMGGRVKVDLIDMTGKWVYTLMEENAAACRYKILLNGIDIPAGEYICTVQGETSTTSIPVLK